MRHEENEIPSCDLSNFARPNPVVSPSPLTAFASSCSEKGPIVPEIQVWIVWAEEKIIHLLSVLLLPALSNTNAAVLCLSLFPCCAEKKHSPFVAPLSDVCQECSLTNMHLARRFLFPYPWEMEAKHLWLTAKTYIGSALLSPLIRRRWAGTLVWPAASLWAALWHSICPARGWWTAYALRLFTSKFHPLGITDLSGGVSGVNFLRVWRHTPHSTKLLRCAVSQQTAGKWPACGAPGFYCISWHLGSMSKARGLLLIPHPCFPFLRQCESDKVV